MLESDVAVGDAVCIIGDPRETVLNIVSIDIDNDTTWYELDNENFYAADELESLT